MRSFELKVVLLFASLLAALLFRIYASRIARAKMTPATDEPELRPPGASSCPRCHRSRASRSTDDKR